MIVITTIDALPDHCYECPCHDGESGYCQADKYRRYSDYRPFWCPLKEIRDDQERRRSGMIDRKKVINGLQCIIEGTVRCESCGYSIDKHGHHSCQQNCASDAVALLKEQDVRELSINEWKEWKANPKRNPICELWENDTSPIWILNPDKVHEPALLMGKLKLFTGKPTFEQCKAVKWE